MCVSPKKRECHLCIYDRCWRYPPLIHIHLRHRSSRLHFSLRSIKSEHNGLRQARRIPKQAVLPRIEVNWPTGHEVQKICPLKGVNVPTLQADRTPLTQKLPGGQALCPVRRSASVVSGVLKDPIATENLVLLVQNTFALPQATYRRLVRQYTSLL